MPPIKIDRAAYNAEPVVLHGHGDDTTPRPLYIPESFAGLSAVTITTITTVWTPAGGKRVRLLGGYISLNAAASVLFEDNAAGAGNFVFRTPVLVANTPFVFDLGNGVLLSAANNVLKATASAEAAITGTLYGVEV